MGSRLGSDYQHEVVPTNTYTIKKGDDVIIPLISSNKTMTLPPIPSLGPDDKEKIIGNDASSTGDAAYAAASGDSIRGVSTMLPGQNARIVANGRTWTVFGGVVDSGTGTTNTSTADSKAVSSGAQASLNKSVADSQNTSQSLLLSVATSAAISG